MIPGDLDEFNVTMRALAASFGGEMSDAQLTGYWMSLDDLPLTGIVTAVRRAMRQCRFMPKAVELRELAGDMSNDARAVHAWGALVGAIGRHGAYLSVNFDDPVINATIRNMGGWGRLCTLEGDEFEKWGRKDFERIYAALCASGIDEEQGRYLAGSHETNNSANGYALKPPAEVATGLPPHPAETVRRITSGAVAGLLRLKA